jgi:hypothetical protein
MTSLSMAVVALSLERKPNCSSHCNVMFYGYILIFKMSASIYKVRGGRDSEQHNVPGYISDRSYRDFVVVSLNCAYSHEEQVPFIFYYLLVKSSEIIVCIFRFFSEPSLNMLSYWKVVS